jgi:hypothetical protein
MALLEGSLLSNFGLCESATSEPKCANKNTIVCLEWQLAIWRRARTLSAPLPAAYTLRTHPTTYHRAPASYKPLPPLTVRPSRMACEPLKTRVWLMGAIRGLIPYAADSRLRFTLRKRLCTPQRPPPSATP